MKLVSKKYPASSILNPARPYSNAASTDITQSPAWQMTVAARELREAEAKARAVKCNVRRMK